MTITPPILSVKELTIGFEGNPNSTVAEVSFEVQPGECVAIVGESGSGKSLTSFAIMGLLPKQATIRNGTITYTDNQQQLALLNTENGKRHLRGREISMIFQEPMTALNPAYTCGFQCTEGLLAIHHYSEIDATEKILELFRQVDLPDPQRIFDSYPHQLSGGQRQRVMIAMALSNDPKLLIADEPTTALDVTVQKDILTLLKKAQEERGMGMLFITHDLGVVKHIADRVIVLFKGKIVEQGPIEAVFYHPQNAYTKGLLACRPTLNHRPQKLPTVADFLEGESPDSTEVRPRFIGQEVLFEITNLNKWFEGQRGMFQFGKSKQFHALKDINLTLYAGESLGLVGESGSGKSTLGRCLVRLLKPESGALFYRGKDIATISGSALRDFRKEVQIIFQDPYSSLQPRQTVGSALLEVMTVHNIGESKNERKEKVVELLQQVGLTPGDFGKYPHQFSGGQRQRIGIARAIALQPKCIVCDESVSALDVSVQAQVLNLLNTLKDTYGFTYLFISHDMAVVKYMSDRMAVMQNGTLVEVGDADEMYLHPKTQYTKTLLASVYE
ncbi:MAG: ABC transporter ATP-binding protein [Schleiferiaceae bacterium]|nr:ABC transporter ATP-binding protein [Schleiferiaceae bacterium]